MPLRFTNRILQHLANCERRPTAKSLARDLRVDPDDREVYRDAIDRLKAEGKIVLDRDEKLCLPPMGEEIVGRFRLNARGFGFVIPDTPYRDGDLFVPRGSARDAISGDTVRAAVKRQSWRAKTRSGRSDVVGHVMEVLERGHEHFVGTLVNRGKSWFVEPDGRSLHDAVLIRDPHVKNAKEGSKVVIELLHYPEEDYHAEGVITKVLGEAGRPDVETQAVIEAHGLRTEFPPEAITAATEASRTFEKDAEVAGNRLDLRDDFIFTIDPPDAKDFDDAISIVHDADADEWTLGVHIADVSNFVKRGTALDAEAKLRGNSVYLPKLVIPMLPEVLSNGVCSLQEGVPRFAKSIFITFDAKGRVLSQRPAATVIKSKKRLTYLEAQALIDGDQREARRHAKTEAVYSDELLEALGRANRLSKILRKRRLRDGMIVLGLPEVELVFDDDGHVIDAVPEDDAYTHTIIEMFMVEANEALARMFDSLGVPILRRIHPEPNFNDLAELEMYARAAQQKLPEQPTRKDIQRLLDATRETAAARAIHFAVLRTLTKAAYSPAMIGHYALASDHYAHFTSPIRRYPDLTLHRTLEAYLDATDNGKKAPGGRKRRDIGMRLLGDTRVANEGELITLGRQCSDTEVEASYAERELRDFLVMQFLKENHLGDAFPGVVTGVTNAGVFVSIERFLVEGLVRMTEMPGSESGRPDRWKTDESTGRLVAQRSGAALGIGDIVSVQITNVDLASRHLDLLILEMPERTDHGPRTERSHPGKGGPKHGHQKGPKGGRKPDLKGGYKKGRRGRRG